ALIAGTALAAPMSTMMRRQEMFNSSGASVSGGSSAVSNPNINNGEQIDSSLIVGGQAAGAGLEAQAPEDAAAGGNVFANVMGTSFTEVNSNSANKDNIVVNAHLTTINGDEGETINGQANNIGDSQRVAALVRRDILRKRDVVFNNGGAVSVAPMVAFGPVVGFAPVASFPVFI
ncbi:hypothetical protein FB639_004826, partial [Coemansia asiatica]